VQSAKGKADSFNAVYNVFSVGLPVFKSNMSVEAYSKSGTDTFGKEHPVFSKIREDSISKWQIQLNFDFVTWNVFLIHYKEQVESNIDFFSENKIMQGIGVSYIF
jgi:hypothetical protein